MLVLAISMCACGSAADKGNTAGQIEENEADEAETGKAEGLSGQIDFSLDEGNVKFVRFEKADPDLTEEDNAYVFVFDYTNYQDKPSAVSGTFWIQFFQNGAELSDSVSYSGKAKEQYELVGAFQNEALKGGTVTFGRIVLPKDDSPVTIMVKRNGSSGDEYQMSEVDITGASGSSGQGTSAEAGSAANENTASENREAYSDVYAAISKNTWLFNGGGDTLLNYIDFKEDKASVGQISIDGNGAHDNGSNEYAYTISDTDITVTTDGGELVIPYSLSGQEISLGKGEYLSMSQVEEGLQGYWKYSYNSFGKQEGYLLVDHGKLKSESATEAAGGSSGEYYYYGPYEGSYTIGLGCFETDMFKGSSWFYNIIDGTPTILKYDHVCKPAEGFPGEDGYSF